MSTNKKPKKKWGKDRNVVVGDIVSYSSFHSHYCGDIGEVVEVLKGHRCIVKMLSGNGKGMQMLVYTAKPKGTISATGENKADIVNWVTDILVPVANRPPVPPKPQKIAVEIKNEEELIAHLTGERELAKNEFPVIAMGDDDEIAQIS